MSDDRAKRSQTNQGRFYDFGTPHASVTTVLGFVDKGGGLANWFKTFIVKELRLKTSDYIIKQPEASLKYWFNFIFEHWVSEAERKMSEGAHRGTLLHKWFEKYIRKSIDTNNGIPMLYNCDRINPEYREHCKQFITWCVANHVRFLESEFVVHEPIVRVAGTADLLAEVNGVRTLIDFKRRNKLAFYWTDGLQLTLLKYLYEAMWIPQVGAAQADIPDLMLIVFYKTAKGDMKMRNELFDYTPKTALDIARLWWLRNDTEKTGHREYIKGATL